MIPFISTEMKFINLFESLREGVGGTERVWLPKPSPISRLRFNVEQEREKSKNLMAAEKFFHHPQATLRQPGII